MTVHFYDVDQALAVLVDLPDGQHVLFDTGDSPTRPHCGSPCSGAHQHLMDGLAHDLGNDPIALVWISHQHSDHIGGAPDILNTFSVEQYVDNGRDGTKAQIKAARTAATTNHTTISKVDPQHSSVPITVAAPVTLTAIVPPAWPVDCTNSSKPNPNECSIGLRIDYCQSSVLLTGDAEDGEESVLDTNGQATLLQLAHHGSDTSSSEEFINQVSPRYAVISAGKRDEGLNLTYCHPRESTVERVDAKLGSPSSGTLEVFDAAVHCNDPKSHNHWDDMPTSAHLWATERDGDIVLVTTGDGTFERQ